MKITDTPNRWRLLWFLLAAPTILLLLAYGYVFSRNSFAAPGSVTRDASGWIVWKNEPLDMDLGFSLLSEDNAPSPYLDIAFCVDRSGSMGSVNDPDSNLSKAIIATQEFARIVSGPNTRLALIAFSSESYVMCPLTGDFNKFRKSFDLIQDGGGTNIAGALSAGVAQLKKASDVNRKKRFVVLISDGEDHIGPCRFAAEKAADEGILFVGLGVGYSSNEDFFSAVFTIPHMYYCCFPDVNRLHKTFNSMLGNVVKLEYVGKSAVLNETFNNKAFEYIPRDRSAFFLVSANQDNGTLEWMVPTLFSKGMNLSYELVPLSIGIHRCAAERCNLAYIDAKGANHVLESNLSPHVLVLSPLLIFFLYFPALLYFILGIFGRKPVGRIADVSNIRVDRASKESFKPAPIAKNPVVSPSPTIILGVGGYAKEVLCHLKHTLHELMPWDESGQFQFISLDSDRLSANPVFCDSRLEKDEIFIFPNQPDLNEYIHRISENPQDYPYITPWLDYLALNKRDGQLNSVTQGAQGSRAIARLGFFADMETDDSVFRKITSKLTSWIQGKEDSVQVFMVGATTGATSSGIFSDAGHHMRKCLSSLGVSRSRPIYAFLSSTDRDGERGDLHKAFVQELRRFQIPRGGSMPVASEESTGFRLEKMETPLFDRVFLFDENEHGAAIADTMFLFCEASQQDAIHVLLGDSKLRIKQYQEEYHDSVFASAKVYSIRYPAGRAAEKIVLKTLTQVIQNLASSKFENGKFKFEEDHGLADICKILDSLGIYQEFGDSDQADGIKNWIEGLLEVNKTDPENLKQPDPADLKNFYIEALGYFLNGTTKGKSTSWAERVYSRPQRLAASIKLISAILDSLEKLGTDNTVSGREDILSLHKEILSNLDAWKQILMERKDAASSFARQSDGLQRFLNMRTNEMETQEAELDSISCRTYVYGHIGAKEHTLDAVWKNRILPVLENKEKPLGGRFEWQISDNFQLRLSFEGERSHLFIDEPQAGNKIFQALFNYMMGTLIPDFKSISLMDKLTPELEAEKALTEGALKGDYVLLTLSDSGDMVKRDNFTTKIKKEIPASKIMKIAKISNPLFVSLLSVDPSIRATDSLDEEYSSIWNDVPFIYSSEIEARTIKKRLENRRGTKARFLSPALRIFGCSLRGFSILVKMFALDSFKTEQRPLGVFWTLSVGAGTYTLHNASDEGRYKSIAQIVLYEKDCNGISIPLDDLEGEWDRIENSKKLNS